MDRDKASFVAEGLKSGFMAGVDVTKLRGHRWFKNYPPALEARRAVTKANNKRIDVICLRFDISGGCVIRRLR